MEGQSLSLYLTQKYRLRFHFSALWLKSLILGADSPATIESMTAS